MLYALKDIDRASDAFEEAVLISAAPNGSHVSPSGPLLLPPGEAKHTAQLVFAANGELPGLRFVPAAKIFQDAMSNGGSYPKLLQQPPGVGDILALYYLSLSLFESPSTANNVGILLASIQHTRAASPSGTAETLALAYYNYGLGLDPKHVHLHTNLGSLLKDINQLDLAIQMYERAVACDGTFDIALTNLANAVKDRGRINDAIMYYRRAVNSNPQFAEAVCGLSTALNSVCDWRGRGGVLLDHGRFDRWHVDDEGMLKDARDEGLGSGLMRRVVAIVSKQLADSSQWGHGILQNCEFDTLISQLRVCMADEAASGLDLEAEIRKWAGRPWEGSRLLRLIERATKVMVRRRYIDQYVTGHPSAICYATTPSDKSIHRQQIEQEAPIFRDVTGWSAEQIVQRIIEDNIHILVNLNGYTRGARNEVFAARPAPIQMSFMGFAGTLGAEWCDYLLADETAIPSSTLRPLRSNVGLESIFRDEELNETENWVYSENIVFCRDTFFCCDHAQSCEAGERTITWEEEQRRRWKMRRELFPNLPDDTIIMGNFNQLYKIDPSTLRTWLRILSNVRKAVLWLLRFPELGECNLRRTAKAWAGEEVASRIIFTDVAPKQQHISRARVCDIFLDTPECNAHTTAADVLWSSTPLLTMPRYPYKMCSRMAASILKGALPKDAEGTRAAQELIASDDAEYEAFATRLAGELRYDRVNEDYCEGRGRLADLRKLLFEAKWTCALFDTHRWVSDLESAYEEAWRRWVAGESGDIHL
ncbi:hypothetical protein ONZ43_g495 [Nemania bipapillata]|uniref:Uncharacterized protein n=1 Tax=Nemania bipapillata TaxID=110536 RepID=A0ACC2J7Z3_9PEZI|nr:hypothetical protein ONZ43_g495 [Nemania bipapillata]